MSPEWIVVCLVAALALATVSVRALVQLPVDQRAGRAVVLVTAGVLGVLLAFTLVDQSMWAVGLVVGLAVVELGPTVLGVVRAFVRRRGGGE